ncbi:ankyrin repeat-containing protein ITN1-like isoform X2 [Amaranthus tricolor]|nr:ankyrin repeat-containing protein ITN1-like isoform X2 [Amaranthus tricolor]XP_057536765.1 ankyrin repeat-containing protein ITN1-like isoform X2 [Amaranthus tricolor]
MEFLKYGVRLYQAVMKGDLQTINTIKHQSSSWLEQKITKGGETALHIAAAAKHIEVVQVLVNTMSYDALVLRNKVGNTALCFAAVSGVVENAKAMVDKNGALPNIRGNQGMTPLYMAVLLGHCQMVWYLLGVTDEQQLTDEDYIGLLTSSINTDMFDVALYILRKNPKLAFLRDAKEETALHALARKPLQPVANELNIWKSMTMQRGSIQEKRVEPQLAIQLTQGLWSEVIKLKEEDISNLLGSPWRLLFVAAKMGKVEFLTTLIRSYPDLIWKVDDNRRTIFHIAIKHRHEEIFQLIYEIGAIKDLIATYKDDYGNNMLHLAGKLAPSHRLNYVSGAALQMQREILWFKAVKKIVRPEYAEAKNCDKKTPQALFTEEHENLRVKGEAWMKKTAESCALVATLIATVVFSAAFQLPGGVNDKGSAVLLKRPSFVVFATLNAISLFSSTASVLMFLSILTSRYAESDFLISLPLKLMTGLTLLFVSIATMIIAFTATFFITFYEAVKWTPIPIALIASVPVALFVFQQYPLLVDIYRTTYKSHQFLFQSGKKYKLFDISSQDDFVCRYPTRILSETSKSSILVRHKSSHRPTASQIVAPCASEPNTPVYGSLNGRL